MLNRRLILVSGPSTPPYSPLNHDEVPSRSDTPSGVPAHHLIVIANALECLQQTQADFEQNMVLNGSLLKRLASIEAKRIQEADLDTADYDELADKINRCRTLWRDHFTTLIGEIKGQAEVLKNYFTPALVKFKEDAEGLQSSRNQLEKESTLLELEVMSYQTEVDFNLLNQQLDKINYEFGLDRKLVDKFGWQYIRSVSSFLKQMKKIRAEERESLSEKLEILEGNLIQLKGMLDKLIESNNNEILTPSSKELEKAAEVIKNYPIECKRINDTIRQLTTEREKLPWALVSSLKTPEQKKLYLDEFQRRLAETANVDVSGFMSLMGAELEKKEMFFRKDILEIFARFTQEGGLKFTSSDVELIYLEMFESQSDVRDKKKQIESLKEFLKKMESSFETANLIVQRSRQFHAHSERVRLTDTNYSLGNSVDLINAFLKELDNLKLS